MNIQTREQHYQILRRDFQAGKINQAAFTAAVDELGFQDSWGRYWLLGAQSGAWYYYDGQDWQLADPRQADQLPFRDEQGRYWQQRGPENTWHYYQSGSDKWIKARPPLYRQFLEKGRSPVIGRFGLLAGLFLAVLLVLLVLPVRGAPPIGPVLAPSPRPPLGGSGGDGGNGGGGSGSSGPQSAIVGQVVDFSTGQPGAGLEVSVSGQIVRTDTDGSYSITGLSAGEYVVSPELEGQAVSAQGPVFVNLDGMNTVTVDLGYYTQPYAPLPTDTPQPPGVAVAVATPAALPSSGAPIASRPFWLAGLGILLIGLGYMLRPGAGS